MVTTRQETDALQNPAYRSTGNFFTAPGFLLPKIPPACLPKVDTPKVDTGFGIKDTRKQRDKAWVANPVDRNMLSRL